jgi:hypothetical protein
MSLKINVLQFRFSLFLIVILAITSQACDNNPDYSARIIYEYDSRGFKCAEIRLYSKGVFEKLLFAHNQNGQIVQETRLKGGEDLDYRITYAYDDKGELIREIKKKFDGRIDYDIRISYEKDIYGAVKKEKQYDCHGELICSIEYEYNGRGQKPGIRPATNGI